MTKSKMIVIWGSEDILSTSIEFLVGAKEDWSVISLSNQESQAALFQAVENTQPDIVIIHLGCQNDPANVAMQLLKNYPQIKVIVISLENNVMDVYSKQKILAKEASDLLDVIESESFPIVNDLPV